MVVVKTEKWDDKKTEMKQITIRVFVAKILNVVIAVLSGALLWDPRLLKHTQYLGQGTLNPEDAQTCVDTVESGFRDQLREKPYDDCVMDTIAGILVQLLIVNFVFSKISTMLKTLVKYLIYLAKKRKGKWRIKSSY